MSADNPTPPTVIAPTNTVDLHTQHVRRVLEQASGPLNLQQLGTLACISSLDVVRVLRPLQGISQTILEQGHYGYELTAGRELRLAVEEHLRLRARSDPSEPASLPVCPEPAEGLAEQPSPQRPPSARERLKSAVADAATKASLALFAYVDSLEDPVLHELVRTCYATQHAAALAGVKP